MSAARTESTRRAAMLAFLTVLGGGDPSDENPRDFDDSGSVGASDLLALLANWGPCP